MITGAHAILFTEDAEGIRTSFRDVLELPAIDAGGGWLIFALPPAELAAHPDDGPTRHELYLMATTSSRRSRSSAAKAPPSAAP